MFHAQTAPSASLLDPNAGLPTPPASKFDSTPLGTPPNILTTQMPLPTPPASMSPHLSASSNFPSVGDATAKPKPITHHSDRSVSRSESDRTRPNSISFPSNPSLGPSKPNPSDTTPPVETSHPDIPTRPRYHSTVSRPTIPRSESKSTGFAGKLQSLRKKIENELSRKRPGANASTQTAGKRGQSKKAQKGTVAGLRPSPALTVPEGMTVADASQLCAAKRTDCVLVVDDEEGLSGIFTAKDLAFRVGVGPYALCLTDGNWLTLHLGHCRGARPENHYCCSDHDQEPHGHS
jgi:hypothetical protein